MARDVPEGAGFRPVASLDNEVVLIGDRPYFEYVRMITDFGDSIKGGSRFLVKLTLFIPVIGGGGEENA